MMEELTGRDVSPGAGAQDPPDDLLALLEGLGDDHRFKLYRVEQGKKAFVTSGEPGAFSEDWVSDQFGGGEYELRVMKPGGKYGGSRRFSISGEPKPIKRRGPAAEAAPAAATPANLERLLTELLTEFRTGNRPANPPENPLALVAALGTVAAKQTESMVAMIAPLIAAFSKPSKGADAEDILRWIELGQNMKGDGEGSTIAALRPLVDPVARILDRAAAAPNPPQTAGALPAGGGSGAPVGGLALMRPWMSKLLKKAEAGSDPGLWADLIADEHPDAVAWLIGHVEKSGGVPAVMTEFRTMYPAIAPHAEWFTRLLEMLTATEDGEEGASE